VKILVGEKSFVIKSMVNALVSAPKRGDRYTAVAIQVGSDAVVKKGDEKKNLKRISDVIQGAVFISEEASLPVKLVALPEGAITGWAVDTVYEGDHLYGVRHLYEPIPNEVTDQLGELCKAYGFYLIGQMLATDPEFFPDRYFNMAFIIDPRGKIIHKHRKTACARLEQTCTPFDIFDEVFEKYGDNPKKLCEILFPVTKTDIGNIGTLICFEGCFPEAARALALNGAEIIYRPTFIEPDVSNSVFEVQNRAHAIFNACYVIAPNLGVHVFHPDVFPHNHNGGRSMIIDYKGRIISNVPLETDTFASAIIDIEMLRDFRVRCFTGNYLISLRVQQYLPVYEAAARMGGIYPKNMALEDVSYFKPKNRDEVFKYIINRLVDLGIIVPPKDWERYEVSDEIKRKIKKITFHRA